MRLEQFRLGRRRWAGYNLGPMKKLSTRRAVSAFTLIELLVIVSALALVAGLLIPGLARARRQATAKNCSNNLKCVGLAFRTWNPNDSALFPAQEPTNYRGVKELVGTGQVFIHFRVMSNELATPKVLVCPQDKAKTAATNFASGFSDRNVSYFVGTDAQETEPQMFLSGDRNLAFGGHPIKPGLFVLTTNNPSLTWTKALHHSCGNVGLADGSVQFCDSKRLAAAAQNQGQPTNVLAIP
jgi:type II secretory pathway pseudopilin PulG